MQGECSGLTDSTRLGFLLSLKKSVFEILFIQSVYEHSHICIFLELKPEFFLI